MCGAMGRLCTRSGASAELLMMTATTARYVPVLNVSYICMCVCTLVDNGYSSDLAVTKMLCVLSRTKSLVDVSTS